ncbi:hypothetical protein ACOMHN_011603 [Nucella lapillus]
MPPGGFPDHALQNAGHCPRAYSSTLPPPSSYPRSPSTRHRKASQVRHVHYVIDDGRKNKAESACPHQEQEEAEEGVAGREKQILHGKCHCYFVERGNVTGLADHHCHHEHRLHPPHSPSHPSSPMSSPRISRKETTPEGSPPSRNKHHHYHHHPPHTTHNHHHSSLQPPDADSFRGRSHSDCAGLARASKSKRTSLSPTSSSSLTTSPNRGKTSPIRGRTPDKERAPPVQRSASLRQDVEPGVSSLRISSSPVPPILVQDASDPATAEHGERRSGLRKLSAHSVDSGQLHYLYEQFLAPGSPGSSGH